MKGKRFESKDYLDFVRSKPCFLCGSPLTEAHHQRRFAHDKGMGLKPSDTYALNVCSYCHRSLQKYRTKWASNNRMIEFDDIDAFRQIVKNLTEYLCEIQGEAREMYPKPGLVIRTKVVNFVKKICG